MSFFQIQISAELHTYITTEQLQNKSRHTAVNPNQYVDTGQDNVRRAGDLEQEGGRVHQRCDRPSKSREQ